MCIRDSVDPVAVILYVMAQFKNKGKHELRYRRSAVGGNITYRYALLCGIRNINDIVPCCKDADKFEAGKRIELAGADAGFIRINCLRPQRPFYNIGRGSAVIHGNLSKSLQFVPTDIAGIQCITCLLYTSIHIYNIRRMRDGFCNGFIPV